MFVRIAIVCLGLNLLTSACASKPPLAVVPPEIASNHYVVTIDGVSTPVDHAALNLYFLNFQAHKHTKITVTAFTDNFWSTGVDLQPWSLNIRPKVKGRTLSFQLDGPAKISISRPGDFLAEGDMLYLFANPTEEFSPKGAAPGLRYFGPGAHHENIDAQTGDSIYLAPGAVIFGALNLWQVNHVKVFGRGVIVYDGPQPPGADNGWMHKRNWHCIVMDEAHDISIEGITCVVRSRTWQIQMKGSRNITFDNIKVIGANAGNANADGMDWLGGGDTVIRNSFFRAADDIFALQSSWEGYGPIPFAVQGEPVTNITVENSVLSTSISNIVRAGWPQKNFEGGNFVMRNSDVLHMGFGGCGVPFALMELWADPGGRGRSSGFSFENIRMDNWYSLVNLEQSAPAIRHVRFTDVMGLETPSLVPSVLKGQVEDVKVDNFVQASTLAHDGIDLPIDLEDKAAKPVFSNTGLEARIDVPRGLIRPRQKVQFQAIPESTAGNHVHYTWFFGDGTQASGQRVKHRFPDTQGTLLDRSGRFRVLVHISAVGASGNIRNTWLYQPIVVADSLHAALPPVAGQPRVTYRYTETAADTLAESASAPTISSPASKAVDLASPSPVTGIASTFSLAEVKHRAEHYSLSFEGDLAAPSDGEYTFLVVANDLTSIQLDGAEVAVSPQPFAQLCGLAGNAARPIQVSAALAKGRHHLKVSEVHGAGVDNFKVFWQGPQPLGPIPPDVLSHP